MSGGKGILQWLMQGIQAAAIRILELPKRREIKRRIWRNIGTPLLRFGPDWRDFTGEIIKARIAEGKFEDACDLACSAYGEKIEEHCILMLHRYVLNPRVDAEDVVQQVFLEFLRMLKAGKYEPSKGSVYGLLLTIAKRRTIGRRRTRNRIVPGRDIDLSELDRRELQQAHAINPEMIFLTSEEINVVQNYRKEKLKHEMEHGLSAKEKQILHWRYTLGHTTDKIAQFTGEKEGTIRSRISRACAKLRALCNTDD